MGFGFTKSLFWKKEPSPDGSVKPLAEKQLGLRDLRSDRRELAQIACKILFFGEAWSAQRENAPKYSEIYNCLFVHSFRVAYLCPDSANETGIGRSYHFFIF